MSSILAFSRARTVARIARVDARRWMSVRPEEGSNAIREYMGLQFILFGVL